MSKYSLALLVLGLSLSVGCDDDTTSDGPAPTTDAGVGTDDRGVLNPDAERLDANLSDTGIEDDDGVAAWDAEVIPDAAPTPCQLPIEPLEGSVIDEAPRCRDGGPLRIRDIRDPRCPGYQVLPERQPGLEWTIDEAVVTATFENHFAVQDPEGGLFSGVWVYNRSDMAIPDVRPGTRVRLEGQGIEYYTLTEFVIDGANAVTILNQGALPEPIAIADASRVADGGDLAEGLESVLIEVGGVRVASTAPDCPNEFGMFQLEGGLRIDDKAPLDYEAHRADIIHSATGVLHYSFDHYKLFPRGSGDLVITSCGGPIDKCEAAECPVLPEDGESGQLIITELQTNPSGDDHLREFIEIFNPGPHDLNVDGWWMQDCGGNRADLSGTIHSGEYYVLARTMSQNTNGGVDANQHMGEMFLPNEQGSVLVFNPDGGPDPTAAGLVDQVHYTSGFPWPTGREPGESLELTSPAADNQDGAAWTYGRSHYGDGGDGTPSGPYRN